MRRESAAETAIRVPGPRNAFLQKTCICAKELQGRDGCLWLLQRGYSADLCAVFAIANLNGRVLATAMHSRQKSSSVDGAGPWTPQLSEGQDLRRSAMANLTTAACLAGFKLKQTSTRLRPALLMPLIVLRPRERIQSAELFELRPRLARRSCSANRPPDCSCSC